jgi:hypothetical protein
VHLEQFRYRQVALVERRFAPILNGRYSRSFTPPSVTFRMTNVCEGFSSHNS